MLSLNGFGRALALVATGAMLSLAGTASAVQFTPGLDARLHTLTSGQSGAEWNTGALGAANGQLSYSAITTQLTLTAELDVLNYYDPNIGSCATDVGSNCTFNYGTNLDITVGADLDGIVTTSLGGGFFQIDINFETTAGTDITIVDPTDSTTVLTAEWQAGTFSGFPTTGLTVSGVYDSGAGSMVGDPTALGFATITGGLYATLFDSGGSSDVSLHLAEFFDFTPTINAIAATIIGTGTLPSFVAEGEGQIFRVAAGDFVPEPSLGLLIGSGVLLGVIVRRRS